MIKAIQQKKGHSRHSVDDVIWCRWFFGWKLRLAEHKNGHWPVFKWLLFAGPMDSPIDQRDQNDQTKNCVNYISIAFFSNKPYKNLFFWCIVWCRDVLFLLSPGLLISKGSVLNHHGTWWDLWPFGGSGIAPHRRQRRQRLCVVNLTICGLRLYKMV